MITKIMKVGSRWLIFQIFIGTSALQKNLIYLGNNVFFYEVNGLWYCTSISIAFVITALQHIIKKIISVILAKILLINPLICKTF